MDQPTIGANVEKRKKYEGMDEWEVKDCIRTLKRAEEIKNDPKKMKAVKKMFPEYYKEEKKEIKSLDDLRDIVLEEGDE
jgi:ferritin